MAFVRGNLIQRGNDRLIDAQVFFDTVALLVLLAGQRAVPGVYRVRTARDLDNRRIVEMLGEAIEVDGG